MLGLLYSPSKVFNMRLFIFIFAVALVLGCINGADNGVTSTTSRVLSVQSATSSTVYPAKVDVSKPLPADCSQKSDERERNICQRDTAVKSGNPSGCEKISKADVRDGCYYKIAVNIRDKETCKRIGDANMRMICESKT
jgi:hypothetical protein